MDLICTVPRPHLLGQALIWPGYFDALFLAFSDYILRVCQSLVCGIRFSTRESLIGFFIGCHPISTILACLFSVGVRGQKLCWKGIMAAKMASRASYLVYLLQTHGNMESIC